MSCGPSWPGGQVTRRGVLELIGGVVLVAMIPENPVVGGTVLRRQSIQSPNFVTGSTGWTINQDGSAEFNNVVIRNGQIVSGTILVYSSSPPALGNLVESIAAVGGTDSKGNVYLSGTASYAGAGTLASSIQGNIINFFTAPGPGGPWTQVAQIAPGSGDLVLASNRHIVAQQLLTALTGATVTGGLTTDTEIITSSQANKVLLEIDNAVANASAMLRLVPFALGDTFVQMRVSGDTAARLVMDTTAAGVARIRAGSGAATDTNLIRAAAALWASDPVAFNNAGAAEVDQVPTFANSWATAAGRAATTYRRIAITDTMEWVGSVTVPAGFAANQNMTTANPAAYQPAHNQSIIAIDTTNDNIVRLTYLSTGILQFSGPAASTAAAHILDIPCQQIRLTD